MIATDESINAIRMRAEEVIDLAERWIAMSGKASYPAILSVYKRTIRDAMDDYLTSGDRATAYKSNFKQSATESFPSAFYAGYESSSGGTEDIDPDADEWLTGRMNEELGYIDQLFVSLKQLRDAFGDGDASASDLRNEVDRRVGGYAATLDSIYSAGVMWGKKNQMLTWKYGDTEHCDTCQSLDGKAHKAKWYISHDYIPRRPGAAMDCGGYRCQCSLVDSDGNEVTL